MNPLLILYPHGLGDCILLTPSLREYYKKFGIKCSVVTLERFKSAKFFDNCPYVDNIFYCKDGWNDYETPSVGFFQLENEWFSFAKNNNYEFAFPKQPGPRSKIIINCEFILGAPPLNLHTEIFSAEEDVNLAKSIISSLVGENEFGFIQSKTGVPSKDLVEGFGKSWLKKEKNLSYFIEVEKDFGSLDYNINVQFEILRRSSAVCLPDSVFYHACHAMNKPVDFVLFKNSEIYNRVKPQHNSAYENIIFKEEYY